ncbi:uncharacterized protein LOC142984478 [Anticarsia gemmatalis]|uniref:uncharacterized protein LOC142984478 n=1 Tax=Anticarsia gemmatalis TaxID=129554 RepID=UPI003F76A1EA
METFPNQQKHMLGHPSKPGLRHTTLCRQTNMLLKIENELLQNHRQRETTGIKKLYNSFFVLF